MRWRKDLGGCLVPVRVEVEMYFRPSPRRIKDLDVMRDIVTALLKRQELGFATTFVKVHVTPGTLSMP